MYSFKQQGKGLVVFFAGMILALLAAGIMVVTLTHNSEKSFQQPKLTNQTASQTEILTPNNATVAANAASAPIASPVATLPATPASMVGQPERVSPVEVPVDESALDNQGQTVLNAPAMASAPALKVETPKVLPPKNNAHRQDKEKKAKALAQAKAKAAEEKAALEKEQTEPAKETPKHKTSTVIQAGAYGSKQAAQEQRANLALLGVRTQVVEIKADGKTIYRVQTGQLSDEEVKKIERTLTNNGVKSYIRR